MYVVRPRCKDNPLTAPGHLWVCRRADSRRRVLTPGRFVGNTMATFVMQSLGCDVSAINTVHFST